MTPWRSAADTTFYHKIRVAKDYKTFLNSCKCVSRRSNAGPGLCLLVLQSAMHLSCSCSCLASHPVHFNSNVHVMRMTQMKAPDSSLEARMTSSLRSAHWTCHPSEENGWRRIRVGPHTVSTPLWPHLQYTLACTFELIFHQHRTHYQTRAIMQKITASTPCMRQHDVTEEVPTALAANDVRQNVFGGQPAYSSRGSAHTTGTV
jgi:hypothetical protein